MSLGGHFETCGRETPPTHGFGIVRWVSNPVLDVAALGTCDAGKFAFYSLDHQLLLAVKK